MRIALSQIDPHLGDFPGNCAKICRNIAEGRLAGADLVVFPELALIGYPPRDLLDKPSFVDRSLQYLPEIQRASEGIGVIVGTVSKNTATTGKPYHNSALFFADGRLLATAHKRLLPSYDVFDEERYFEPGESAVRVDFRGEKIGLTICEDVWNVSHYLPRPLYHCDPVADLRRHNPTLLVNISASPFHLGKASWVGELLKAHAVRERIPVLYVNQVGGYDELIFQGHSMVWNETGTLAATGADFREDMVLFDTTTGRGDCHASALDPSSELIKALALGLRDYTVKCGFQRAVIGLSGGVDSALVACLAVLALGHENVLGVGMPGPYNAPESLMDAAELARRLGIAFETIPIGELFDTCCRTLSPAFRGLPPDATEENLQARLRGLILMALSNKFNRLLLSTGNKSEIAVGYCTLYGDMNGGLAVIGDVPKTMVYELARKLNSLYDWIPERILTRAPSAELRPDQKDQDTLPPYPVLDGILAAYVERRLSPEEIAAEGWDEETVRWVVRRVEQNEYKRWQAPPILRVTTKAFGMGRRNPIAHGYR
ncbi:MAG: NAD+ synthase [Deltaproteobacteria bacterium]|nr:NAD+ synthase [Deltaproteobacteria bacterium]